MLKRNNALMNDLNQINELRIIPLYLIIVLFNLTIYSIKKTERRILIPLGI